MLTYEISKDRARLVLFADADTRQLIAEENPDESELLEQLIANSELCWVDAVDTGDLTNAPLLGILGGEISEATGPHGAVLVGADRHGEIYRPILERWGYANYQIRSFADDLLEHGKAVFHNHW